MGASYAATVTALEGIVERCATDDDRGGYFAAMYLAVTNTMRARSEAGRFQDSPRMERFITGFAQRYLDAEDAWRHDRPCTDSWRVAFEATQRWRPIILQHLLLGMNAHINLDLGVTASGLGGPDGIDAVRADFDAVNDVLAELVDGCQGVLSDVSPWIGLVDRIGGGADESIIRFSLVAARRQAWDLAVRLSGLEGDARADAIAACDRATARLARIVEHPGFGASAVLLPVRLRERTDPGDVMRRFAAVRPADL